MKLERDPLYAPAMIGLFLHPSMPCELNDKEREMIAEEFDYFGLPKAPAVCNFGMFDLESSLGAKIKEWLPNKTFKLIYRATTLARVCRESLPLQMR